MPESYQPRILSASTDGQAILITDTATLGQTIHTAVSGTSDHDDIHLWLYNNDSSAAVTLSLEVGAAGAANTYAYTLGPGEEYKVPVIRLQNSKVLTAFASTGSKILIRGHVTRYNAT